MALPHRARRASAWLLTLPLGACAGAAREPGSPSALVSSAPEDPAPAPGRGPCALDGEGVFYVLGATPEFPRVRYLDGQLSLNESCAIRVTSKLSRRIPPLYVNGQPIGFC